MKNVYIFWICLFLIIGVSFRSLIWDIDVIEIELYKNNNSLVKKKENQFTAYEDILRPKRNITRIGESVYNQISVSLNDSCPTWLETSIWYMGKHSLNWNKGFPAVDTGFFRDAGEAHTSICDRFGNLLFYTDNNYIMNAKHEVMDNGIIDSPFGFAGSSSTMNLALRQPGKDSIYWMFYPEQITDQTDTFAKKLRYAIIDMSQNGGLGKVVQKHQILMDTSSERVEGIRHCNGKDWWIIGQNAITEQFTVWKLDQNGLSLNGKMNSGVIYNIDERFSLVGYLKSSHSGALIAEVTSGYDRVNRIYLNAIELHHFDPSTGTIYNGLPLTFNLYNEFVYGAEFSSDDSKLYITGSKIWQIDLSVLDTAEINKSLVLISDQSRRNTGAPVLGPDGKIYITSFFSGDFLYTIEKPNKKGLTCDFQLQGFYLGDKSGLGAPHFAQSLQFPYRLYTHGPYEFCTDTTVRYVLTDPCPHSDLQWEFPDGGVITNHNGDTIEVYFAKPGYKRVIAAYPTPCGYKSDTLKIKVNNCNCKPLFNWLQQDTLVCIGSPARFKFNSNADSVFINGKFLLSDSFDLALLNTDTCLDMKIQFAEFCDSSILVCIKSIKQSIIHRDSLWFCSGDTLYIDNFPYYGDTLLSFTHQDQSGCDSVSYIQLIRNLPSNSSTEQVWICSGDSVRIDQKWFKDSIDIDQTHSDRNGCDSNHIIHVRVYPKSQINQFNHIMCKGDSVLFSGVWYKDSLQKEIVFPNHQGCDSIWALNIKLYASQISDTSKYEMCPGDSIQIEGKWIYDTAQIETHYQDINGCDSIHWSLIKFKEIPKTVNLQFYVCQGDSIWIENNWIKNERNWIIRKHNQNGCDSTYNYTTTWYDDIMVDVLTEQAMEESDSLLLDPYYSSNVSRVIWSPSTGLSCINCFRPKISPAVDTKYYITVKDDNGCTSVDSIFIRVIKKEKDLYVPNSFSPNGDNINDHWGPILEQGSGTLESIQVFDRWGNRVFECSRELVNTYQCLPWDGSAQGKKCLPGVYVYQIVWKSTTGVIHKKAGDINLFL